MPSPSSSKASPGGILNGVDMIQWSYRLRRWGSRWFKNPMSTDAFAANSDSNQSARLENLRANLIVLMSSDMLWWHGWLRDSSHSPTTSYNSIPIQHIQQFLVTSQRLKNVIHVFHLRIVQCTQLSTPCWLRQGGRTKHHCSFDGGDGDQTLHLGVPCFRQSQINIRWPMVNGEHLKWKSDLPCPIQIYGEIPANMGSCNSRNQGFAFKTNKPWKWNCWLQFVEDFPIERRGSQSLWSLFQREFLIDPHYWSVIRCTLIPSGS